MRFILEGHFANSSHLQVPTHSTGLKGRAPKVDQKFQMELARFLSLVFNEEDGKKRERKGANGLGLSPELL